MENEGLDTMRREHPVDTFTEGKRLDVGKKVIDIHSLIDVFEAQEGIVEQIVGKTGNGKTYEATRRALQYLQEGHVVYTTWKLILPDVYDQRASLETLIMHFVFGKKDFYVFDYRKNWRYLDLFDENIVEKIEKITDAIVMVDEGQDIFDARQGMVKTARQTITRSRHMRKTLIIISQRAQAVDITARANVSWFYKCVKTRAWFWPFATFFKVYRSDEMDEQNYPIWEERLPNGEIWRAECWRSHFADKSVYAAYNSWYLADGIERSQTVNFDAYTLTRGEMFNAITSIMFPKKVKSKAVDKSPTKKEIKTLESWSDERKQRKGVRQRVQPETVEKDAEEKQEVPSKALLDPFYVLDLRPKSYAFRKERNGSPHNAQPQKEGQKRHVWFSPRVPQGQEVAGR